MASKSLRYVLVFSQGRGLFAVESLSRPGEFQSTDLAEKVCTCERFLLDPVDKGKPCRHLRDLDKLKQAGILDAFL